MHTGDNMYDNEQTISRAVLVTVDTGEFDAEMSVKELSELARTAGAETAAVVIQKRPSPDTATYIGSGRLEQLRGEAEMAGADLLIFDCELTANQTRNIEQITDIRVIDRTTLILDIFAMRAASAEGRIQVELAQQKYRLAHLAGKGVQLSRLGGGIGTRGPGETKLETDRRHIRTRIGQLEDELEQIRRHRDLIRRRRKKKHPERYQAKKDAKAARKAAGRKTRAAQSSQEPPAGDPQGTSGDDPHKNV